MEISVSDWIVALSRSGVRLVTAARWAPVFHDQVTYERFSADASDIVAFCGQILHESNMLERLEEDLNYSAGRMLEVWPRRFPGGLAEAQRYAFRPEDLANKVYGGRLGNVSPGDGWRYRGRGLIQLTGLGNYRRVEEITGIPIVGDPDMLAKPEHAMRVSIAWWEDSIPDEVLEDVERVTKLVNAGGFGFDHRLALTNALKEHFA